MACQQIIYILVLTIFGLHGITLTTKYWIQGKQGSFTCTDSDEVIIRLNGTEITRCLTGGNDICDPPIPYFTTTVDGATDTVTFTIINVNRIRDTGTWSCDNNGSYVIDVKVEVKPSLEILMSIIDSKKVKFTCEVIDGFPSVLDDGFTWEKDGTVMTGETNSTIYQAVTSNITNYVCTGNNGVGIGRSPLVNVNVGPCNVSRNRVKSRSDSGDFICIVVKAECRSPVVMTFIINVFLPVAIIVIIAITVIYIMYKDQWLIWFIIFIISLLCDCCLWYLVYVLSDPEPECQDIPHWILQITVVIITPRGMIYRIYLKIKVKPDYAICLILLLFLVVPSAVTLFILISMMCRKKNGTPDKAVAEGGTGTRQLPKLPNPGRGKRSDKVPDVESGNVAPKSKRATGKKDTTAM